MTLRALTVTVTVVVAGILGFACSGTSSNADGGDAGISEAGPACAPGRQVACACIGGGSGAQVCKDDGSGYGSCACGDASIADAGPSEDSGDGGPPSGTPGWARAFGAGGQTAATSVAIDPTNGDVALTGNFGALGGALYGIGNADFGGGLIGDGPVAGGDAATGSRGAFVARFAKTGAYEWAHAMHGDVRPSDVAVDGAGNVIIAGAFTGDVDLGAGLVTATGTQDVFFARFDAAGTLVWARHFGLAATSAAVSHMLVDGAGNIFVAADPGHAALDLGCGQIAAGNAEVIAKLAPSGTCVWSTPSGGGGTLSETIALDPSGNVLVGGGFSGLVDLGDGGVYPGGGPGPDAFLQKLSPSGVLVWVKTYESPGAARITGIGSDASGNILVDGTFCNTPLDLGCGPLTAKGNGQTCGDIFLAKLDPAGACVWSKNFGDDSQQLGGPLAVDALGGPVITGGFTGNIDFGSGVTLGAIATQPYTSAYVAKFTAAGAYEWAYAGNLKDSSGSSIGTGIAASGAVVVTTGTFMYGALDLGGHALTATGQQASYLATFAR